MEDSASASREQTNGTGHTSASRTEPLTFSSTKFRDESQLHWNVSTKYSEKPPVSDGLSLPVNGHTFRDLERKDVDADWKIGARPTVSPAPVNALEPLGPHKGDFRDLEKLPLGREWNLSAKPKPEKLVVDTEPVGPPTAPHRDLQRLPPGQEWNLSAKIEPELHEAVEPFGPPQETHRQLERLPPGQEWSVATKVVHKPVLDTEPFGPPQETHRVLESLPPGQEWNVSSKVVVDEIEPDTEPLGPRPQFRDEDKNSLWLPTNPAKYKPVVDTVPFGPLQQSFRELAPTPGREWIPASHSPEVRPLVDTEPTPQLPKDMYRPLERKEPHADWKLALSVKRDTPLLDLVPFSSSSPVAEDAHQPSGELWRIAKKVDHREDKELLNTVPLQKHVEMHEYRALATEKQWNLSPSVTRDDKLLLDLDRPEISPHQFQFRDQPDDGSRWDTSTKLPKSPDPGPLDSKPMGRIAHVHRDLDPEKQWVRSAKAARADRPEERLNGTPLRDVAAHSFRDLSEPRQWSKDSRVQHKAPKSLHSAAPKDNATPSPESRPRPTIRSEKPVSAERVRPAKAASAASSPSSAPRTPAIAGTVNRSSAAAAKVASPARPSPLKKESSPAKPVVQPAAIQRSGSLKSAEKPRAAACSVKESKPEQKSPVKPAPAREQKSPVKEEKAVAKKPISPVKEQKSPTKSEKPAAKAASPQRAPLPKEETPALVRDEQFTSESAEPEQEQERQEQVHEHEQEQEHEKEYEQEHEKAVEDEPVNDHALESEEPTKSVVEEVEAAAVEEPATTAEQEAAAVAQEVDERPAHVEEPAAVTTTAATAVDEDEKAPPAEPAQAQEEVAAVKATEEPAPKEEQKDADDSWDSSVDSATHGVPAADDFIISLEPVSEHEAGNTEQEAEEIFVDEPAASAYDDLLPRDAPSTAADATHVTVDLGAIGAKSDEVGLDDFGFEAGDAAVDLLVDASEEGSHAPARADLYRVDADDVPPTLDAVAAVNAAIEAATAELLVEEPNLAAPAAEDKTSSESPAAAESEASDSTKETAASKEESPKDKKKKKGLISRVFKKKSKDSPESKDVRGSGDSTTEEATLERSASESSLSGDDGPKKKKSSKNLLKGLFGKGKSSDHAIAAPSDEGSESKKSPAKSSVSGDEKPDVEVAAEPVAKAEPVGDKTSSEDVAPAELAQPVASQVAAVPVPASTPAAAPAPVTANPFATGAASSVSKSPFAPSVAAAAPAAKVSNPFAAASAPAAKPAAVRTNNPFASTKADAAPLPASSSPAPGAFVNPFGAAKTVSSETPSSSNPVEAAVKAVEPAVAPAAVAVAAEAPVDSKQDSAADAEPEAVDDEDEEPVGAAGPVSEEEKKKRTRNIFKKIFTSGGSGAAATPPAVKSRDGKLVYSSVRAPATANPNDQKQAVDVVAAALSQFQDVDKETPSKKEKKGFFGKSKGADAAPESDKKASEAAADVAAGEDEGKKKKKGLFKRLVGRVSKKKDQGGDDEAEEETEDPLKYQTKL